MYELILVILLVLCVLLVYVFACKILSTNTMNRPSLFLYRYLDSENKNPILNFFRLVLDELKDSESGFFARLNAVISSVFQVNERRIQIAFLGSKIAQSLIVIALFLPLKLFPLFLLLVLAVSWVNQKKVSVQTVGIILGLILIKFCIEFLLHITMVNQNLSFEAFPGYLYLEFSKNYPWMFIINGALLSPFVLNISFILPVLLVSAVVLKLSVFQYALLLLGVLIGFCLKFYVLSNTARGILSAMLQESFLFYVVSSFIVVALLLIFYWVAPVYFEQSMTDQSLLKAAVLISGVVFLSTGLLGFFQSFWRKVKGFLFPDTANGKMKYKYSKSVFQETFLGLKILMNSLRTYVIKQRVYLNKSSSWLADQTLDRGLVNVQHTNFQNHFEELKTYLTILLKSDEIALNEEDVILCSKFLDGAKSLENNFYKKTELLESLASLSGNFPQHSFISRIVQDENAIFEAYEKAVYSLKSHDLEKLFQIVDNRGATLRSIEDSYVAVRSELDERGHKDIALELIQLFQINLWILHEQFDILQKWSAFAKGKTYILGHMQPE